MLLIRSDCCLAISKPFTLAMHFTLLFFFYTHWTGLQSEEESEREREEEERHMHKAKTQCFIGREIYKNSGTRSVNFEPC